MRHLRHLLLLSAIVVLPSIARAQESDEEWLENCRSQRWNGRRPSACSVDVKTVAARALLTVRPGPNGAVQIIADDRKDIEVHTRLQASGETSAAAGEVLEELRIDLGSTLTVDGPTRTRDQGWSASFVIYVPRSSNLDISTSNGPVAVKDVVGTMDLRATNGPIMLSGVGGDVTAHARNGPLHVRLTGTRWQGAGLDAETENGPVTLEIPSSYNAALETGTVNGPMETDFPLTMTVNGRNWKRITTTLGSGGAPVRVVTTNGPLSLRRP